MTAPAYAWSPKYRLDWKDHVFWVRKYELVAERLAAAGARFLEPPAATDAQLGLVHTAEYLRHLELLTQTPDLGYAEFEVPCGPDVLEAFRLSTGGTILAARKALELGAAGNVGGGFHHAFAGHGEGFCLLNDLAVAIRVVQAEGLAKRVSVIDLDLHQGNGTAAIFDGDPSVHTFSMHQENNYPRKERSTWDIGLDDYAGDEEYLGLLRPAVPRILDEFRPDLVLYQAGADPFEEDKLGLLKLTIGGLAERDRIVYRECRKRGIPVAVTLGGGYARRIEDVVTIHHNTLKLLGEA